MATVHASILFILDFLTVQMILRRLYSRYDISGHLQWAIDLKKRLIWLIMTDSESTTKTTNGGYTALPVTQEYRLFHYKIDLLHHTP